MLDREKCQQAEEATSNNARAIYKILQDLTRKIVNTCSSKGKNGQPLLTKVEQSEG